jgi:hypothetical protein
MYYVNFTQLSNFITVFGSRSSTTNYLVETISYDLNFQKCEAFDDYVTGHFFFTEFCTVWPSSSTERIFLDSRTSRLSDTSLRIEVDSYDPIIWSCLAGYVFIFNPYNRKKFELVNL